jgi:histone H3/H4
VAYDDERLLKEIGTISTALDGMLAQPQGLDALRAILLYLSETHPGLGAPKIVGLLKKAAKKRRKVMKDALDELREEGRVETLLEQLASRFGRVPAEAKARIRAANEATLRRWSILVLTAPTLEAVLSGPSRGTARKAAPAARAR